MLKSTAIRALRITTRRNPSQISIFQQLFSRGMTTPTEPVSPVVTPPPKRRKGGGGSTWVICDPDGIPMDQSSYVPVTPPKPEDIPAEKLFVPPTIGPSDPASKQPRPKKKPKRSIPDPYSPGDILFRDITDLLGAEYVQEALSNGGEAAWTFPEELNIQSEKARVRELRVSRFTVSGESLSVWPQEGTPKWAILVPFAHPGDLIRVKIWKHDRLHSFADLLEILEYNEETRGGEGDRRKFPNQGCKYFGICGGCQLQPLPYAQQLLHKKKTVELAYSRFSGLDPKDLPLVKETIPSPKQWGYRTKITPHFDAKHKSTMGKIQDTIKRYEESKNGKKSTLRSAGSIEVENPEEEAMNEVVESDEAREGEKAGKGGVFGKDIWHTDFIPKEEIPPNGKVIYSDGTEWVTFHENDRVIKENGPMQCGETRVGFDKKGVPGILDIEECPIAAPVLNKRFTEERARIKSTILSYKRGATLLLRSSLPPPSPLPTSENPFDPNTTPIAEEDHIAITNHKEHIYERVGDYIFSFAAGSFFQNNNAILVPLTEYVKEAIFPSSFSSSSSSSSSSSDQTERITSKKPTHLVDAYCGSGLFGITLSKYFERIAGVEISMDSIKAAKINAEMNGLEEKSTWLCGDAGEIFRDLPEQGFLGDKSCMIIDPPRKGCDEPFLKQLLEFKPITVVYVSCNVHTQARDIGWLLNEGPERGVKYELESLRGFDLFPQTAHVESVAVLRLQE